MEAQAEVTQDVMFKSNPVPENDTDFQETVSNSLPSVTPKWKVKREDTELGTAPPQPGLNHLTATPRSKIQAPVQQANEALLEKLHIKFASKPWSETLRLVHYCMDKPIKTVLTGCHPILKCKERLEGCVKAKSLSDVMGRIEAIAQEKGLETHIGPGGKVCYITSEMFYIEVQVKRNGNVYFVKVAHHGETPQESEDLLQILRAKDFEAFGTHLQGLLKLHKVQGDGDTKAKVYHALQCLENYLYTEFNLERMNTNKNKMDLILYGKVGYITPRRGGIPMTTEFFVSPYESVEEGHSPGTCKIGAIASVSIYGTVNQYSLFFPRLFNKPQEEEWDSSSVHPIHNDLVNLELPACFIMTFAEPMVLMTSFIHKIQDITGFPLFASDKDQIHEILIRKNFQGSSTDTGGKKLRFIKSLPDCMAQCYHIHSSQADSKTDGAQVSRICFTASRHVALILEILRCQAVFTTLICSCLSNNIHTHDCSELLYFEVSLLPRATICISFQHPTGFSLCSVYISIVSSMELNCKSYLHKSDPPLPCNDELLTKILTRCMSIPITMRTIFKKAQEKVAEDITPTNEQLAPQTSQDVPKSVSSDSEPEQTLEVKPALTQNTNDEPSLITDHDIDTDLIKDSPLETDSNDSHKLCSSIVQETSFSTAQDDSSETGQCESTAVENTSVCITEEQHSVVEACSPIKSTEQSPIITEGLSAAQETSFPASEDTNSSIPEKLNSRFMEDPSSSFPDDLNNGTKDDVG